MASIGKKKSVLVVDDHPFIRDGVKGLIERSDNFECVAEAGSGAEGIQVAKDIRPDLITMDMSLPDMSGVDAIRELKQSVPDARAIVLSMHSGFDYVAEAFRAGALGYVAKEAASDKLIQGLEAISKGEFFLDGQVSMEVVGKLLTSGGQPEVAPEKDEKYSSLTAREKEVLSFVAKDNSNRQIAEKLSISPKTVENHRTNLMKKLDIHSKIELIRYAARLGIIDVDIWKA
jgi:DNA-binding NarL/FixJ family response regulator